MRAKIISIGLVVVVASILVSAAGAKVIGRGSASGSYTIASASGTVTNPHRIWIKATNSRGGKIAVTWVSSCARDWNFGAKSATRTIRSGGTLPVWKMARADSCDITASASSYQGGRLTITINAW